SARARRRPRHIAVRCGAHLPWPVHRVAHAPVPDPPLPLAATAPAPAGHCRVPEPVGVVHPAHGLVDVTRGMGEVGLRVDGLAPGQELVGAETVGLDLAPGQLAPFGTLVAGADAVLPVVGGGEGPAWPADRPG